MFCRCCLRNVDLVAVGAKRQRHGDFASTSFQETGYPAPVSDLHEVQHVTRTQILQDPCRSITCGRLGLSCPAATALLLTKLRAHAAVVSQREVALSHSLSELPVSKRLRARCLQLLTGTHSLLTNAGGTASGKTTVCDQIMQRLHDQCVVMLSQDSFYRGLTPEECKNVKGRQIRTARPHLRLP